MASCTEIRALFSNDELRNRITVATVIASNAALAGTPTAAQQKFANWVFSNPDQAGSRVLMAVLAANNTFTAAQITGATDATLQSAVNSVIPNLTAALFS